LSQDIDISLRQKQLDIYRADERLREREEFNQIERVGNDLDEKILEFMISVFPP
jgi:hypothetical protein